MHGLSSQWHHVFRTNIDVLVQPVIRCTLLPAVLGISLPIDAVRNLVIPCLLVGVLRVFNPTVQCAKEYCTTVYIMDITEMWKMDSKANVID